MNILMALLLATSVAFFSGQPLNYLSGKSLGPAPDEKPEATERCSPPEIRKHIVAAGENLSVIADRYGLEVDTLLAANPESGEIIYPGDELVILPQNGLLHVVEAGDTVSGIARSYGVAVEAVVATGGKRDGGLISGERVFIAGARRVEQASRGGAPRFSWPVYGELTSPFGYRWGRLHSGIDIAADAGTPVKAARPGRVVFAGWRDGYGYTVMIEHGRGFCTLYAHLSVYLVDSGQYAQTGQVVGYVGSTGNSTGPHLHFEIIRDGQPLNPAGFLPSG